MPYATNRLDRTRAYFEDDAGGGARIRHLSRRRPRGAVRLHRRVFLIAAPAFLEVDDPDDSFPATPHG